MKKVVLIKFGELFLKGLNRPKFERTLVKNIQKRVKKIFDNFIIKISDSIIYIFSESENYGKLERELKKVFGISNFCVAFLVKKQIEDITQAAIICCSEVKQIGTAFKIKTKRSDKNFKLKSPEISKLIGKSILKKYKDLRVDLLKPQIEISIEIREEYAFVYNKITKGAGGMPTGVSSKVTVLLSGGIDSPVAGYMMARRGVSLIAIHFASPPYTSYKAQNKVERLVKKLIEYAENIKLFVVKFTAIQETIEKNCNIENTTIIGRRMMIKIAEKISNNENSKALITGESLGQVASQTMNSLICTNASTKMLVLRPLIGMDKNDIVNIAKKIETFKISIEPFEDCCTVFTPKHPAINPKLEKIIEDEKKLNETCLISEAIKNVQIIDFDKFSEKLAFV
ncbi:MAG: tRNA 4-thiouridine(8) synthase ThiI [Oscillospiraceae bacterium]|jgi:thiamine biosynthesis protein ThiI|nr:tRNA 4-thiouridine(8) synthase ThiI [Oscillospiraceae bacterium]